MNPLVLIILDGFGFRSTQTGNAVALAKAPHYQNFLKNYPHTLLEASGEAVGLPPGVMGNSEVGHLTIGSGRIHYQDLSKINYAIEEGSFFKNPVLEKALSLVKEKDTMLHLMGLLSDAGVHSHQEHLFALLKMAKKRGIQKIAVHCFLDGRDTPPSSSQKYVAELQKELKGIGEISTLIGRYYAMDRDKRWDRIQIAYEALVEGKGKTHSDPVKAVEEEYAKHQTDEFVKPVVFGKKKICDDDVVIFFNFRPDRAREITQALTDPKFTSFERKVFPKLGMFVCMTEYDKTFSLPVAFSPTHSSNTLAEIISRHGLKQFHTAETEKYAHVTYFLNGGIEKPFPGEERLLIPSPKEVATYDEKPEMSARTVCDGVLEKIRQGIDVVFVNFANTDMVGHSGKLPETIKAVEVIDDCLGKIVTAVLEKKGTVFITADHGNCEQMMDENGGPHTAHTTNPVPFLLINDALKKSQLRSDSGLQDIAPTILDILKIKPPSEMTGKSLILK